MASAVIFIRWGNYVGHSPEQGLFRRSPLAYNSSQERLHDMRPGDQLWLVSRCPDNKQYYFVGMLHIESLSRNEAGSRLEGEFGPYALTAAPDKSIDLARRFPAEGLLRSFTFKPDRPIKYGSSIGQSLQAFRALSEHDHAIMQSALARLRASAEGELDQPAGLWTKCAGEYADYFTLNWTQRLKPLAFLLYDSPPQLPTGAPVFIHSDRKLRLLGRFLHSEFVSGHKRTVGAAERIDERERVWKQYRAATAGAPEKPEFDRFWDAQDGVRSLFIFDSVIRLPHACQFGTYRACLGWGYPRGVGYRYLTFSQALLLLRACHAPSDTVDQYLPVTPHDSRDQPRAKE